tara:strand:+ start:8931 stop:10514 length:1584 start_codon:yes stop_codon:yes gene_type:complete
MNSKRPNILLVVTDQEQSWSTLPDDLELPAHQKMREAGVSFNKFHVNCSPCGPSRSNLYTGHHTQRTHVHVNPDNPPNPVLPTDLPTIGHMLREAGYYTAYKGKWHMSLLNEGYDFSPTRGADYPNVTGILEPYGFSDYNFYGETVGYAWDGYRHDKSIAGDASKILHDFAETDKAESKPWFLAVNFVNPHDIMFFDATGKQNETRLRKNFISPLMPAPGDELYREDLGYDLPESFFKDDLSSKPEIQTFIRERQSAFYGDLPLEDIDNWRRFQNYYFNCLRDVDQHIGTVLEALDQSNQADNTIVIYTSDHGERAGAHGLQQKAGTVYEEESCVPFIVKHPDVAGGGNTDALGGMVDVAPTILSMAGISTDNLAEPLPGIDLSPAVNSPAAKTKRDEMGSLLNYTGTFHWQRKDTDKTNLGAPEFDLSYRRLFRGVVWDKYKFARYFAPAEHHIPEDWDTLVKHNDLEVYDLDADPKELDNLGADAASHKDLISDLNAKTNALIAAEIGDDRGSDYPGPIEQYNTI